MFVFLGIAIGLIVLYFLIVAVSSRLFGVTPYIAVVPRLIPVGFSQDKDVLSGVDSQGRFYIFSYKSIAGGEFTYHLRYDPPLSGTCQNPPSESTVMSDFADFSPKDSRGGCVMTLTDKNGIKTRVYIWWSNSTHFYVFSKNLSVSDTEVTNMANSLIPKVVMVRKQVN